MKIVTLTFSFEDDDLEKFVEENGNVFDWAFGEICQNQDFGFLIGCNVEDKDDE